MKKLVKHIILTLAFVLSLTVVNNINAYADEEHKHTIVTETIKATTQDNGCIQKTCSDCKEVISTKCYSRIKTIKLSKKSYTYNGKVKKPSVIVKDEDGKTINKKYYTVTYQKGRKKVGRYKVTVKFKGVYEGKKTLKFDIKPKRTSVKSVKGDYRSFKVTVNKRKSVSGYQVQWSETKDFKNAGKSTLSKSTTTQKTISDNKMKDSTTYYARVRTYKTVKYGKKKIKIYSNWSKAKKFKTSAEQSFAMITDKEDLGAVALGVSAKIFEELDNEPDAFCVVYHPTMTKKDVLREAKRNEGNYARIAIKTKESGFDVGYKKVYNQLTTKMKKHLKRQKDYSSAIYAVYVSGWIMDGYNYYIITVRVLNSYEEPNGNNMFDYYYGVGNYKKDFSRIKTITFDYNDKMYVY